MQRPVNSEQTRSVLRQHAPLIVPSLLACDFANLQREIRAVEEAGARLLHLDVMDGHFVPNLSIGLPVIESIRRVTDLPLDVHLMIDNPAEYASRYRDAGADIITVHGEVLDDPRPLLDEIRAAGALPGLSINPPTALESITRALPHCELVLIMSVMPGFGGQELETSALEKLRALRDHPQCDALLEVDGGVNQETIRACVEAGADLLVAGTAVFEADDYGQRMAALDRLARHG